MPKFDLPENFDFSKPTQWPEWKDQFDMFRIATKPDKEEQIVQISSVVYAIRRDAHARHIQIYKSFTFRDVADENPERNRNKEISPLCYTQEKYNPRKSQVQSEVRIPRRIS